MNMIELDRALRQLRLSGMADVLETRLLQAQANAMAPIDLLSSLVSDELACRSQRLLERRHKQAQFRDPNKHLDNFDFQFNPKMNRNLIFDLATAAWVGRRDDSLFLEPPGSGKTGVPGDGFFSLGWKATSPRPSAMQLSSRLPGAVSRSTQTAGRTGRCHARCKRKEHMDLITTVALLIIDDLGMRKLPLTAAEQLLEIIMRRYQRASTLLTSNRPVEDWGKLLGESAAVSAMLDRLLHHGHVLKCGPRSWRTKTSNPGQSQ